MAEERNPQGYEIVDGTPQAPKPLPRGEGGTALPGDQPHREAITLGQGDLKDQYAAEELAFNQPTEVEHNTEENIAAAEASHELAQAQAARQRSVTGGFVPPEADTQAQEVTEKLAETHGEHVVDTQDVPTEDATTVSRPGGEGAAPEPPPSEDSGPLPAPSV